MDLGAWLLTLGLERYEEAFSENEIDDTVLPNLTSGEARQIEAMLPGAFDRKLVAGVGVTRLAWNRGSLRRAARFSAPVCSLLPRQQPA